MGISKDDADQDIVETIWRRKNYLRLLENREETPKSEVVERLGISESTAYKRLRELMDHGLIERSQDGYRLTLFGKASLDKYREFRETRRYSELLKHLPPETDFDPRILENSELVLPEKHTPNRPLKTLEEIIGESDSIKGFSPFVLSRQVELLHDRITEHDLSLDMVLTEEVVRHLFSEYHKMFVDTLRQDNVEVWKTDKSLPYGLVIRDNEEVFLVINGSNGGIEGIIRSDSNDIGDWAEELFDSYRENSEKFFFRGEPPELMEDWLE